MGEAFLFLPQLLKPKFMIMEEAEAAYVFQLMIMETTFVFLIFALFRVQRLSRRVFGSLGFKEKFLYSWKLGLEWIKKRGGACNVNNIRATMSYVNNITDTDSNASQPSLQRTSKQPSNYSLCLRGHSLAPPRNRPPVFALQMETHRRK